MPFIVTNITNAFDPIHQNEYATEALADAAARDLLRAQPNAVLRTAQVIKRYTAEVTVSVQEATATDTQAEGEA